MTRHHPSILVRLGAAALLGLAAACTMGEEFQRGYLVDERAVNQVQSGMSAEQVLQTARHAFDGVHRRQQILVLHQPASPAPRRTSSGDSVVDQRVTAVYFDQNLKVERVALYGLQDGKIFDFISRDDADRRRRPQLRGPALPRPRRPGSRTDNQRAQRQE